MTYEYRCFLCEHLWEFEQKITDDPITHCEKCGEASAQRLISGGQGFQLLGGGWFAEGYSKK